MKKKNIMIVIVIGIIFLVYGLTIILLSNNSQENPNIGNNNNHSNYGNNNSNENSSITKNNYDILIINDNSIWKYKNNIWRKTNELDNNEKKYYVYINQIYFGKYYLQFINKWNLLDDNNNFVSYEGKILAYSENLNIKVRNFSLTSNSLEDLTEINNILDGNILLSDLSINEKLIIDLDNNSVEDKIVNISNLDSTNQENYFNLCYIILNGEMNILFYEKVDEENVLIEPVYNLQYVLNINNKTNDSIIIQKSYYSKNGETTNLLYEYNNEKYNLVIE